MAELLDTATWRALVIDDDPGIRQSIRLCLEAAGARVLGVSTLSAALDAIERGSFDVIFLDLRLGQDSGLEALPEILRRQQEAGVIVRRNASPRMGWTLRSASA